MRGQKRLYFPVVSAQTIAMKNTDQSSAGKPSIFVTRRWPADAEAALSQYFAPTFNLDDTPLSAAEMAAGFASPLAWDFARYTINIIIKRLKQLSIIQGLASRNTKLASIILNRASEDLVFA